MIFIFEDKEDDLLSKLFQEAYDSHNFIYAKGNGNLERIVRDCLVSSEEGIIVYLDTIPDNKDSINIYKSLRRLSLQNDFRVIIMPIVCAEYYFIMSLVLTDYVNYTGVDTCIRKDFWRNSSLVEEGDKVFVKNFEKFCKLILLKCVKDCIKNSIGADGENTLYGYFYTKDCKCEHSDKSCRTISLKDKAINYVRNYPVIPSGSSLSNVVSVNIETLWAIHRRLVDEFNGFVDKYSKEDSTYAYTKIKYIK